MKTIIALSCHVNNWGAEKSFCTVVRELKARGNRVVVLLARHGEIENTLQSFQIEYYILPLTTCLIMGQWNKGLLWKIRYLWRHIWITVVFIIRLERFLSNNNLKPDVVYTNTIIPSTGLYLAFRYHIPHIIHIREITDEDFPVMYYIGKRLYLSLLKKSLGYAICISQAVMKKFYPFLGEKCRLVYNGLPLVEYKPSASIITGRKIKILFVGRLSNEKGIIQLLDVVKSLIEDNYLNFVLDLWGSGPLEEDINEYVTVHNLASYVNMQGYGKNIAFDGYDIAIMSSPYEAFGRTTVEYMMAGLAVIGHNGGATPELIKDKECGLLYNDSKELKNALIRLLSDGNLRLKLGMAAKERARILFSEDRYVREVCDLFETL